MVLCKKLGKGLGSDAPNRVTTQNTAVEEEGTSWGPTSQRGGVCGGLNLWNWGNANSGGRDEHLGMGV